MGCLTVTVQSQQTPCICTAETAEGVGSIEVDTENQNTPLRVRRLCRNKNIRLKYLRAGQRILVEKSNRNINIKVTAALACNIGTGDYEFFLVTQGPFIVQDGYFLVGKKSSL